MHLTCALTIVGIFVTIALMSVGYPLITTTPFNSQADSSPCLLYHLKTNEVEFCWILSAMPKWVIGSSPRLLWRIIVRFFFPLLIAQNKTTMTCQSSSGSWRQTRKVVGGSWQQGLLLYLLWKGEYHRWIRGMSPPGLDLLQEKTFLSPNAHATCAANTSSAKMKNVGDIGHPYFTLLCIGILSFDYKFINSEACEAFIIHQQWSIWVV